MENFNNCPKAPDESFIQVLRTIPFYRAKQAVTALYTAYTEAPVSNDKEQHQDVLFILNTVNDLLDQSLEVTHELTAAGQAQN